VVYPSNVEDWLAGDAVESTTLHPRPNKPVARFRNLLVVGPEVRGTKLPSLGRDRTYLCRSSSFSTVLKISLLPGGSQQKTDPSGQRQNHSRKLDG
jgi:hypothetical protein